MVTTAKTVKHSRLTTNLGSWLVFQRSVNGTLNNIQKILLVNMVTVCRGSSTLICTPIFQQRWWAD